MTTALLLFALIAVSMSPYIPSARAQVSPDFSISLTPNPITVPTQQVPGKFPGEYFCVPPGAVNITVAVTSLDGFAAPVNLTYIFGQPGFSATFSPPIVTPSSGGPVSSTFHASFTCLFSPSVLTVEILGTSGQISHAVNLTINVVIPPPPPNTSLLTLQSQDTNGQTFYGYYATIYDQSGNLLVSATYPFSFRLNNSQVYTLQTSTVSFGSNTCSFDRWSDTGDTSTTRTISITSDTNVIAVYNCAPAPTTTINVSTVDLIGNTIVGYYTVLYQGGAIVDTQFSPASFTANIGQTYTVLVDDYGSCLFDHWQDTGSTVRQRDVTPASIGLSLLAVYNCAPKSTVEVTTVNVAGNNNLTGYFATLMSPSGIVLQSCYSPCSFTVNNGEAYVVTVANYGGETFNHWSDGGGTVNTWGGSRVLAVPNISTMISLTAVYSP